MAFRKMIENKKKNSKIRFLFPPYRESIIEISNGARFLRMTSRGPSVSIQE